MDENAKLYELGFENACGFIIACFETIGIKVDVKAIFYQMELSKIMTHHGNLKLYKIRQFFTEYLAKAHKSMEKVKPTFTSYFIKQMRDAHFNAAQNGGVEPAPVVKKPLKNGVLSNHEKCMNFYRHCLNFQSMPANADWLGIYEYLHEKKWFKKPKGFDTMPFQKRWKHAMQAVHVWTGQRIEFSDVLMCKTSGKGNLDLNGTLKQFAA